jgi:hypothetical protein
MGRSIARLHERPAPDNDQLNMVAGEQQHGRNTAAERIRRREAPSSSYGERTLTGAVQSKEHLCLAEKPRHMEAETLPLPRCNSNIRPKAQGSNRST